MLPRYQPTPPIVRWCLLCGLLVACSTSAAKESVPAVLELWNGDFVRGRLLGIEEGTVRWDGEFFTRTLEFPRAAVRGMKYPPPRDSVQPADRFIFELNNRDVFFGDLLKIEKGSVEVHSQHLGNVQLRRGAIQRILRIGPDAQVHPVPTRRRDWTTSDMSHWRGENGSFVSDTSGASLFADIKLPASAMIELELAWSGTPSFAFYLGTDDTKEGQQRAFSIEVWGEHVVAQRRNAQAADVAPLQSTGRGSLHVHAYVDQAAGKLIVLEAGGALLAELDVSSEQEEIGTGIMLFNRKGNVQLKHLQIRGWSGAKPRQSSSSEITIGVNGQNVLGDALRMAEGKITLYTDGEQQRFDLDDVSVIDLPAEPFDGGPPSLVAAYQDGSRITGQLVSANDRELVIRSKACDDPLQVSLESLRGFSLTPPDDFELSKLKSPRPSGHRAGSLAMMDTRLTGWLVDQATNDVASCLVWRSELALGPGPLRRDVYGRIVYVPTRAVAKKQPVSNSRLGLMLNFQGRVAIESASATKTTKGVVYKEPAIHLRTGDVIPCKVTDIDERGVHIESPVTESKLIPHDTVKAAQLINNATIPRLNKIKRQRLLTLPRMQKYSPPQHLVFSSRGDVLRGSVTALNQADLELEIRLASHHVPRSRVATIVWLHEDELSDSQVGSRPGNTNPSPRSDEHLLVQVVSNDGPRFSFFAESFSDQTIQGSSDLLKNVRAQVGEIDQLFFGGFIDRAARSLPFHRWRMTPAIDPRFVLVDDDGQSSGETVPGTESKLVGKPAPPITLKMLEGDDFTLADHLGHCVVLDFWATWCGPCLQVMPQVEQVVSEFADQEVRLFAINLEERAEQIRATLERRGLDVPVALDRDGVAAARYQAQAIPQTVVVGPDGNVERVFVGTSRDFADQLRAVLTELTKPES